MTVKIKLCGFKKLEDVNYALGLGIDYIGLNNIAISPRFLNSEEIVALVEKLSSEYRQKIVVLINHYDAIFMKKIKELGVKLIQSYLSSDEDRDLLALGFDLIKVFSVEENEDVKLVCGFDFTNYSYCLLDTKIEGALGGTGKTFNWNLFSEVDLSIDTKLILAGGLKPSNVNKALNETKASFIDLASGVELEPGEKSYALIKELILAVRG